MRLQARHLPMQRELSLLDIQDRAPVWLALSELWLDTELAENDFAHLARVLAHSPYSLAQIKSIHDAEVAPVLWRNLVSVAGEWTGFDEQWLVAECSGRATRRHEWLRRLQVWWLRPRIWRFTWRHWRRLGPQVRALRMA